MAILCHIGYTQCGLTILHCSDCIIVAKSAEQLSAHHTYTRVLP